MEDIKEKEIIFSNVPLDRPTKQDYQFFIPDSYWAWEPLWRPKDKIKLQDQHQTPACGCFWGYHIVNANNINEDTVNWWNREQITIMNKWNEFCKERWYSNHGTDLQTFAAWMKNKLDIDGYSTISNTLSQEEQVKKIRQALSLWKFIYTGSQHWDWGYAWSTGIYKTRTDGKIVWHLYALVMDVPEKQAFLCPNSWGTDRGEDWYFYLPYSEIKNIYTKLVIFDKDDSGLFLKIKEKSQAMEWVRQLKKIYAITQLPLNDKKLCKSLADSLRIIYWFTDKDL